MSSADRLVENASTPTHVGQTSPSRSPLPPTSLYPHARGANLIGLGILLLKAPLPPRTWGKPAHQVTRRRLIPSTPTHVGQTPPTSLMRLARSLYPHARGANRRLRRRRRLGLPLPPRTWGKRCWGSPSSWRGRLYPHARGANPIFTRDVWTGSPLPPRTWGKLKIGSLPDPVKPSTPTHVGQTAAPTARAPLSGLYPHARGANGAGFDAGALSSPLPPRTWGKLL